MANVISPPAPTAYAFDINNGTGLHDWARTETVIYKSTGGAAGGAVRPAHYWAAFAGVQ